jgi:hypothetical protein
MNSIRASYIRIPTERCKSNMILQCPLVYGEDLRTNANVEKERIGNSACMRFINRKYPQRESHVEQPFSVTQRQPAPKSAAETISPDANPRLVWLWMP